MGFEVIGQDEFGRNIYSNGTQGIARRSGRYPWDKLKEQKEPEQKEPEQKEA